jgi:hypothetical protein
LEPSTGHREGTPLPADPQIPSIAPYIALEHPDEEIITDPPARVLEVIVINGQAALTLRTVDEHENVSPPVESFDIDAETLIAVLQAGLTPSPYDPNHPAS